MFFLLKISGKNKWSETPIVMEICVSFEPWQRILDDATTIDNIDMLVVPQHGRNPDKSD